MKTQGIIFDMDGLIIDSEAVYIQANQRAANHFGFEFTPEDQHAVLGTTDVYFRKYFSKKLKSEKLADEFVTYSYKTASEIIQNDGVALKPGLTNLLDYCDQNKIKRVIASSNFSHVVQSYMASAGVKERFDQIVGGDQVKNGKPDPEIFLKALDLLAVQKPVGLVLEDSPNGILAASRAQIPAIMVPDLLQPTPSAKQQALKVVDSLDDVITFLESQR